MGAVPSSTSQPASFSPGHFGQGLAGGSAGVALVVALFTQVLQVNVATAGFVLLVVVLVAASVRGFAAGAVVALVATLCFNYFFLPPVGRFTVADPEDWVALFAFLLTALVAGHLSNRAQQQAEQARGSQRETEQLYALSRAILLMNASQPIGMQAAQSIAQIFDLPSVAVFDAKSAETQRGGPVDLDPRVEPALRQVVRQGNRQRHEETGTDVLPIALGGRPIGALALRGMAASDGAKQSVVNLVAIALERVRAEESARRAEAARQSEEFKSTLLDAIAHEFQTPLTSIKAAATGLRMAEGNLPPDQRELAAIMEEETDRLSQLVTEAVRMAQIDAGKTSPQRSRIGVTALFEETKKSFEGRGDERLHFQASGGEVWADRSLIVLALRQLTDNALKYSSVDSPVRYQARGGEDETVLCVSDQGPGIPERDRERIFEKFCRGNPTAPVPGTGLGLHIAREIARMHGGDLWVESNGAAGSVFCLSLPVRKDASA